MRPVPTSCLLLLLLACSPDPDPEPPGPVDADGDGVSAADDCDDTDPLVHPGAAESCDGRDTDCDPSTGEAGTIAVPGVGGFTELALAAAAASTGDSLILCEGEYVGDVVLPADVSLEAQEGASVTLTGSGTSSVIRATGGRLALSGLTIRGGVGSPMVEGDTGTPLLGGGVNASNASELVVQACTFEGNEADQGGHIAGPSGGSTDITDTVFRDGTASSGGGALSVEGGLTTVRDSSFTANSAVRGGAIYATGVDELALIVVSFTDNTAETAGGAVAVERSTSVYLHELEASGNQTTAGLLDPEPGMGGTLFLSEVKAATTSGTIHITGSRAVRGTAVAAVGISDTIWLYGWDLSGNEGPEGSTGTVYLEDVHEVWGWESTISGNTATEGGGLWLDGADYAELYFCTFADNVATDGYGGGAFFGSVGFLKLEDTAFTGNTAFRAGGLRIYSSGGGDEVGQGTEEAVLTRVEISGNESRDHGGGLHSAHLASLSLEDCTVSDNSAAAAAGGGVFLREIGAASLTGSTVSGNALEGSGGGLYVTGRSVETLAIVDSTLEANTALDGFGGALSAVDLALVELHGTEILGNEAAVGGGVYLFSSPLEATDGSWGAADEDNVPSDVQVSGGEAYDDVGSELSCEDEGPCS